MINKFSIVSWLLLLCVVSRSIRVYTIDIHDANERKSYIVYMGEKPKGDFPTSSLHTNILDRVLGSGASKSLLHSYKNFNGFVVKLTHREMQLLAGMKGVVSVFPNEKHYLHTTKSWDFMGFTQQAVTRSTMESDIIIGVFDSGIWPESDSFDDTGLGPPPAKWKGTCDTTLNFTCNNKIIGAKYYRSAGSFGDSDIPSPRDSNGHGTHCASTAAGSVVSSANMVGLGDGTARGGAPSARIAVYKVCWSDNCADADVLAAFDDAIDDGVDIISISLGGATVKDYFNDVKSIGAFHAMKKGILTVNSAGNSGPEYSTTASVAPWFLSVAASTIDRNFVTNVQLGNDEVYKGVGINTFDLKNTMYPLIYGGDAPNSTGGFTSLDSMYCTENSLDPSLVMGKIVLCEGSADQGVAPFLAGATGVLTISSKTEDRASASPLPASDLELLEGSDVYLYYTSTRQPTVTIFKSEELTDTKAPYVASFSSRGPNTNTLDLLKPDISAPGVHILAAWPSIASVSDVEGDERSVNFNIISGTSMACPHVSGVAAYIKSFHPTWSPAAIKSALMTTAATMDRNKNPQGEFAYGSGHLNPLRVLYPGLVYDSDVSDYVSFLCGQQGYTTNLVRLITGDNTTCSPTTSSSAWDLNLPSFALAVSPFVSFSGKFTRTVTNVGPSASTYRAKVPTSAYFNIQVQPSVLSFKSSGEKLSFVVTIEGKIGLTVESSFLIWDDGSHMVRSPIVVYAVV